MNILPRILPYAGLLAYRDPCEVDLVVVHCTELPDLATAREYGERIHYPDTGTGNSGHYYIDRDGHTELWVPENRVAHHVRGYNKRSIGIELVNIGRFPDWFHSDNQEMSEKYPPEQIESLRRLLDALAEHLPSLGLIAGHEDLDTGTVPATDNPDIQVKRKCDPGQQFPWREFLEVSPLERFQPG